MAIMKEFSIKFKEWWQNLNSRERHIMLIGSVIALLVLFYQFVWSPYLNYVSQLRHHIAADQKLLTWMQVTDKKIHGGATEATPVLTVNALTRLKKKINQAGLESSLTQLKQAGNEIVEM